MPIYEYECEGCQAVFEVRQKISDPAPSTHSCGSTSVRRILSPTTFVLKGTGWYKTDYADKKPPADGQNKSEGEAKGGADAKSDKDGPKKPADGHGAKESKSKDNKEGKPAPAASKSGKAE